MVIEKSALTPGWYVATQELPDGRIVSGSGETRSKAIENIFEKLNWLGLGKLDLTNNE